jgi:integrase
LRAEDVDLSSGKVWVEKFKGHDGMWKPLVPSTLARLKAIQKKGAKAKAKIRSCGARGIEKVQCEWSWPVSGYLFPSRTGSKKPFLGKDAVVHAISRVRPAFVEAHAGKWPELQNGKNIRSHSGRRHTITWMVAGKVPDTVGMTFAQISSPTVYKAYTDLSHNQLKRVLTDLDNNQPLNHKKQRYNKK